MNVKLEGDLSCSIFDKDNIVLWDSMFYFTYEADAMTRSGYV